MRVAIFTDNDFDKVNGVTTTLKAVLRFAGPLQPRIYTAADFGVDTAEYYAAASVGLGLPWYRDMRVYMPRVRAFAKELRAHDTQVIHVTTPGPVGLAGRWLARRLGLPLIGSYHTHLGDYTSTLSGSARLGRLLDGYMRWFYEPCEQILAPSRATRDLLVARGYRAERIKIWGRGVDTERFTPARASSSIRNGWHVDRRRPAILYAGRLSREKGLSLLEPLQTRLHRHGLDHRLIFVGDGPMRGELETDCPDGAFLGTLPHERVAVAMASADIFLFPSATDTLGNVVLEAQASGLPVVVSDKGGPQEHMLPGTTGFVSTAGDVESFANAVLSLIRQPDRRTDMARQARAYAESRDWPNSLSPLFDAWGRAAARRQTAQHGVPFAGSRPAAFQQEITK